VPASRREYLNYSILQIPKHYNLAKNALSSYVEGAIWQLKSFGEKFGDMGKKEVNDIVTAHVLTLGAMTDKKVTYAGVEVVDGKLRMIFNPENIGSNIDHALSELQAALNEAPQPGGSALSPVARLEISQEWEPKAEGLRKKFADMFQVPDFKIDPGFEGQFAMMKAGGKDVRDDWESRLGYATKEYFEAVEWTLKNQKFGEE
jgi:hypothetical protein